MTQAISPLVSLYDRDYLLWAEDTVNKLRTRNFDQLDIENLIEEIEDLGRSQKRELRSRLKTLLEHLLKRIYVDMPQEFNGWERTIRDQRTEIKFEIADSPSLKRFWNELFDLVWGAALENMRDEYQSKGFDFPDTWQFSRDMNELLNTKFWE
ncbi:DUF29 domain-containing protein [Tumidithrix helvetica]|uniref:DUF29 domain-containing protein n=1 Tax=Tumidithrix helvetica TaxID=3457545 RepID=UPI003CC60EEE